MKRIRHAALGLLALSLAFIGPAQTASAQSVLSRIVEQGTLRVALSGGQPPFNFTSRDGELMGLEVDLARLLGESLQAKVEFVKKPFPQLLDALKAGEADMILSGMAITPRRNLQVAFAGPYSLSGKSILTKSSTLAAASEAGDINQADIKLVALGGSTSQRFVELVLPQAQLTTVDDYDAGVEMVINGSADAMVADMPICVVTVLRHPNMGLATLTRPLTVEPIGVAVAPGDPLLLNLMDNYLTALETTGLLDALRKKWLEDGSWVAALP